MSSRFAIPLALCAAAAVALCALLFGLGGALPALAAAALCFALGRLTAARTGDATPAPATDQTLLQTTWRGSLPAPVAGAPPAHALLDATLGGMREGVLVVDPSQRVVTWNEAARALFDHSPEVGQPLVALTRNPAIHSAYSAALARGEDGRARVELHGAESRVVELRVSPLRAEGAHGLAGAIGVFFDITRIERLERVRQEFLTNVSHELRTPLTAIIAYAETLESGALGDAETARRHVEVINKNAARMRALVEDILELSDIESGSMKVEPRRVGLSPAVRETFAALASKAAERGVELRDEIAPGVSVRADPVRLEQMLTNLVDNAIKFGGEGATITVRHETTDARDLVSVVDTGDGIPPAHLPRIFERFYRVDRSRSREVGGTGLGLAIVKHLARAHGGEVSARSTPGEGSVFTIELPRVERQDESPPADDLPRRAAD